MKRILSAAAWGGWERLPGLPQGSSLVAPLGLLLDSAFESEQQRRTFVVVERSSRWLVMQDQDTVVVGG